jgi:hypothetical protein
LNINQVCALQPSLSEAVKKGGVLTLDGEAHLTIPHLPEGFTVKIAAEKRLTRGAVHSTRMKRCSILIAFST